MAIFISAANSEPSESSSESQIEQTQIVPGLIAPAAYKIVSQREVSVDGELATLTRFEREDRVNAGLGGEHFSALLGKDERLKGFVHMQLDLLQGDLPSKQEARKVSRTFLATFASDLLDNFEESWIAPHDEKLKIMKDGESKEVTLTGMKVKMRNANDGLWFWVIVGSDHQVMVFERDIKWLNLAGKRGTEKWLHDAWLVEQLRVH